MASEIAVVAGGCFWCVEAVFERVEGVFSVESGYTGGHVAHPDYRQVCTGLTGHAEAVRIRFDPAVLSYGQLLDMFFATHDPTQTDGQGNDIGPQYRSAIFPGSDEQQRQAGLAIGRAARQHDRPIVTTIEPAAPFHAAEAVHRGYYRRVGAANPYCPAVIDPKLRRLERQFPHQLKG